MKQLFLSHRSTRIALSLVALLTFSLFGSTATFAATSPGATVAAGEIATHVTYTNTPLTITLDGTDHLHQSIGTLAIVANDFTGDGLGWTITTDAHPFTVSSHTLTTMLSTTGLTCAIAANSTCSTDQVSPLSTLDTTLASSGPQTLASASKPLSGTSYGMGSYKFDEAVYVDFPANIFKGSYSTTIDLVMVPQI